MNDLTTCQERLLKAFMELDLTAKWKHGDITDKEYKRQLFMLYL